MRFFGGAGKPVEIRMTKLLRHSTDEAIPLEVPIGRQREGASRNHSVQTKECHAKSAKDAKDAKQALGACLKIQFWVARATGLFRPATSVFSVVAARATERGLQSAGVLVSEGGFGILRVRLCGAHVPAG